MKTHSEHSVARWACFFGVSTSTSGYYTWHKEHPERQQRLDAYGDQAEKIFDESGGTYGAERIAGELRKRGIPASFGKVKRIMTVRGLFSVHLRYRRSLTDSRGARDEDCGHLLRDMTIPVPFQALSSDITYIPTGEGFAYTCTVRDIRSGVVLTENTAAHMKKELVLGVIRSATGSWRLPKGTVFHSDRGSQYTSATVREQLRTLGLRQSFSRTGKPGDNAWSESFFSILKRELIHPLGRYATWEEARQGVLAYIHGFYNIRRIQKKLGYLSPMAWLNRYYDSTLGIAA